LGIIILEVIRIQKAIAGQKYKKSHVFFFLGIIFNDFQTLIHQSID